MFVERFKAITGYLIVGIGWLFLFMLWFKEAFNAANISASIKIFYSWAIWGLLVWLTFFILRKSFPQNLKS